MKSFDEIVQDMYGLIGLELSSLSGKALKITITEVNEGDGRLYLSVEDGTTTSRPFDEFEKITSAFENHLFVHVDSVLSGSGSSRNRPETIMANLPYIEWTRYDNKKCLVYVGEDTHDIGTTKYMDEEEAKAFKKKYDEKRVFKPRVNPMHPLNQIIYGAPGTGKTYSTVEFALAIIENRPVDLSCIDRVERASKMEQYNNFVKCGQIIFTTFHQSYGYEDFIQGIRPEAVSGSVSFQKADGVFKVISDRALEDPNNNYVIVIDEINRGNISKIFGELITLIEDDKRCGELNQISVTLPLGDAFAVPNNLYIIGTMNSADKSISLIDTAIRRRFNFIEMAPDTEVIENNILRDVLQSLNDYLRKELRSTDLLIGHAYFMGKDENNLKDIMNNNIIPLLYEYFYDEEPKVKKALECLHDTAVAIDETSKGRIRVKEKD